MRNILPFILPLLVAVSCITQEKCLERFPPTHLETIIETHDTTLITRDTILYDTLSYVHMDTIRYANKIYLRPRLLSNKDIKVQWLNDSIARISARCKGDTVTLPAIVKTKTVIKSVPTYTNKIPLTYWVIISLLALLCLILLILK